jgi:hypothetical protein
MRIASRSIQWGTFAIATETPDARQPQYSIMYLIIGALIVAVGVLG